MQNRLVIICGSYLQDLLKKSHVAEKLSFPVRVPSNFHHGLVMLLHLFSHLTGARIGIRHLCDWALFLNSIEEKEFLKLFQEPIVVLHIEKDVFNAYMTVECLAKDFLGYLG